MEHVFFPWPFFRRWTALKLGTIDWTSNRPDWVRTTLQDSGSAYVFRRAFDAPQLHAGGLSWDLVDYSMFSEYPST